MQYCIIVASLCSVIGPESSRHFLNQSDTKLKPTATWSPTFSRASGTLLLSLIFTGSSIPEN